MSFEAPVAIQAGTTYIASYHAPNGHYALTPGGFAGTGAGSSPVQALANGTDGPNGVYRYGAAPAYPTDTCGAGNYWVDVAFSTTRPVDDQPPTVLSSAPAPGATGVPPGSAVLVTFSEDLDPASITPGSFQLLDANGSEVTASRAYDPLTRTASLVPATDLAWGATYTARVRGGAAGVTDEAGNPLAADWNATFTTKACPCSLWATPVPGISSSSDHSSVELGVKFTADLAGMVTGLRFYQGAGNVGPHIGSLWSADGTLLARVAFPASSGPGWQEAQFGEAGADRGRRDLRRLVLRAERRLRGRPRLLHPARLRQPAAPDAGCGRCLPVFGLARVSDGDLGVEQLLGGRDVRPALSGDAGTARMARRSSLGPVYPRTWLAPSL